MGFVRFDEFELVLSRNHSRLGRSMMDRRSDSRSCFSIHKHHSVDSQYYGLLYNLQVEKPYFEPLIRSCSVLCVDRRVECGLVRCVHYP